MDDCTRSSVGKDVLDAALSLLEAVHDAGGCLSLRELRGMSMEKFLVHVAAPNDIRFHYNQNVTGYTGPQG